MTVVFVVTFGRDLCYAAFMPSVDLTLVFRVMLVCGGKSSLLACGVLFEICVEVSRK